MRADAKMERSEMNHHGMVAGSRVASGANGTSAGGVGSAIRASGSVWTATAAIGVVLLMVLSSALAVGLATNGSWLPGAAVGSPRGSLQPLPSGALPPSIGHAALATGNLGSFATNFFSNVPLPLAAASARPCIVASLSSSCPAYDQLNVSNDPSSVYTSQGVLAVAYTSLSDHASCAGASAYTVTNVEVATSTNQGASFGTPVSLSNSNCTSARTYPSAWQPSITALSNGTLVLAYVEYNLTGANGVGGSLPPTFATSPPPRAQLVLSMSYTGGSTWTSAQVLNVSTNPAYSGVYFVPAMPSVAAYGRTIYLAWERLGTPYASPTQNSQIAMMVSTSAGKTWSPVLANFLGGDSYYWSQNPDVLVSPSGEVFLAYDSYPGYYAYGTEVWVSSSTHNGTLWQNNVVGFFSAVTLLGQYIAPVPSMAWSSLYDRLDLVFAAQGYDRHSAYGPELMFYTSANNATSWTSSTAAESAVYDPTGNYNVLNNGNPLYSTGVLSAAVAADASGDVYVSALVKNATLCFRNQCGTMTEVVSNTTDNGTTFGAPILVNGNVTPSNSSWYGEKTALVTSSGHLYAIYPEVSCPIWPSANCSAYPSANGTQSEVVVAQPYTGTGVSLTFAAKGVNATTNWTVTVMEKSYRANGSSKIVISGIPAGSVVEWVAPGLNISTTLRLYPQSQTVAWETALTGSTTDTVSYVDYYPLTVDLGSLARNVGNQQCGNSYNYTYIQSTGRYYYNNTYVCVSPLAANCYFPEYTEWDVYSATPTVYTLTYAQYYIYCSNMGLKSSIPLNYGQSNWVENGTQVSINEYSRNWAAQVEGSTAPAICPGPGPFASYTEIWCYYYDTNVSFVSWTGVGPSSVTTNQSSIAVNVTGPVTEDLNLVPTGSCGGQDFWYPAPTRYAYYSGYRMSCSIVTANVQFSEKGLPTGTYWGVTLSNATGSVNATEAAPAPINLQNLPVAETYTVSPWTILSSKSGKEWVGTVVGGDLVLPPFTATVVTVDYALVNVTNMGFNVSVNETGLPGNASWGYSIVNSAGTVNSTLQGHGNRTSMVTEKYGEYTVSGLPVAFTNSTGYYVGEVIVTVHNENTSTKISAGSVTFNLTGDANLTVVYYPEFWLQTSVSGDGTVTPSSEWVQDGATVRLQATPGAGSYFVGWTGSGLGATGQSQRHSPSPTIRPLGPVVEIAVFAPTPPPTYSATVEATGLPTGQAYTVLFGGIAYTGTTASWTIGNLSAGVYALAAPYVYDNVTLGARYVATNVTVAGWTETGTLVTVGGQNGTISITYGTQYILELSATPGGTISPAAGSSWVTAGTSVALVAVPLSGYHFVGWSGSGVGARNSSVASLKISVNGEVTEAAQFAQNPPTPPATYTLTVMEGGLPAGTGWNVSVAGMPGAIGTTSRLTLTGLNGSYMLEVPILATGVGVRWSPAGTGTYPVSVTPATGNGSYTVNFTEQFLVTTSASGVGNATPTSSEWVNAGTTVQLQGAAGNGWELSNWTGSGNGSYTGNATTTTISVTGPVSEVATFVPVPPAKPHSTTSSSSTAGLPLALGILVILLVVGLLVGMVLARRRRPPTAPPVEAWEASPTEGGSSSGPEGGAGESTGSSGSNP